MIFVLGALGAAMIAVSLIIMAIMAVGIVIAAISGGSLTYLIISKNRVAIRNAPNNIKNKLIALMIAVKDILHNIFFKQVVLNKYIIVFLFIISIPLIAWSCLTSYFTFFISSAPIAGALDEIGFYLGILFPPILSVYLVMLIFRSVKTKWRVDRVAPR